jgi:hypothetical protein
MTCLSPLALMAQNSMFAPVAWLFPSADTNTALFALREVRSDHRVQLVRAGWAHTLARILRKVVVLARGHEGDSFALAGEDLEFTEPVFVS